MHAWNRPLLLLLLLPARRLGRLIASADTPSSIEPPHTFFTEAALSQEGRRRATRSEQHPQAPAQQAGGCAAAAVPSVKQPPS